MYRQAKFLYLCIVIVILLFPAKNSAYLSYILKLYVSYVDFSIGIWGLQFIAESERH